MFVGFATTERRRSESCGARSSLSGSATRPYINKARAWSLGEEKGVKLALRVMARLVSTRVQMMPPRPAVTSSPLARLLTTSLGVARQVRLSPSAVRLVEATTRLQNSSTRSAGWSRHRCGVPLTIHGATRCDTKRLGAGKELATQ